MICTNASTQRMLRVLLISVSLLVVACSQASEDAIREGKRADIAKLLYLSQEATVPEAQSEILVSQISAELKRSNPGISARALAVALHVNLDKTVVLERETFTAQAACCNRC
jgi:hypothetical protein